MNSELIEAAAEAFAKKNFICTVNLQFLRVKLQLEKFLSMYSS